jgi:hypothetical protein
VESEPESERGKALSPRRYTEDERQLQAVKAWEMRVAGHSVVAIGDALNIHPVTVHRRLESELQRRRDVSAGALEKARAVELERLDNAQLAVVAVLSSPDVTPELALSAADRLRKISERRSKLLGLDTPLQVESTLTVHQIDGAEAELTELLNEARAKAANDERLINDS